MRGMNYNDEEHYNSTVSRAAGQCPPCGKPLRALSEVHMRNGIALAAILALLYACPCAGGESAPQGEDGQKAGEVSPPAQAQEGPGGAEYPCKGFAASRYEEGEKEYWIFSPDSPETGKAPLVIFMHGAGAVNPNIYGAWIEHIARRGNIVVYPRYQKRIAPAVQFVTDNSINAVRSAIQKLKDSKGPQPDLTKIAVVGHSLGGVIAANIAALSDARGIPKPKVLMSVEPGITWLPFLRFEFADLSAISPETLMLCVAAEKDNVVGDIDARKLFEGTPQIPADNKDYVLMLSDSRKGVELKADHFMPVCFKKIAGTGDEVEEEGEVGPLERRIMELFAMRAARSDSKSVNALDYNGLWKLFDGLCDSAFNGRNRDAALGNTPRQKSMGKWSDGTPVREPLISDNPADLPKVEMRKG